MKLKIRPNESRTEWGLIEDYGYYWYGGEWQTTLCIAAGGVPVEPHLLIGGDFVPVSERLEAISIERYLKAKKPVFSLLGKGLIVKLTCPAKKGGGVEEGSGSFSLWLPKDVKTEEGILVCERAKEVPELVTSSMEGVLADFKRTAGDRAGWLTSRVREVANV